MTLDTNNSVCPSWEEKLNKLIPEKTDNVIIHGYRQLTRGKIKDLLIELINEKISEAITLAIANRGKQWAEEVMKFYDIGNCDKINNLFNTMDSNLKQSNIK